MTAQQDEHRPAPPCQLCPLIDTVVKLRQEVVLLKGIIADLRAVQAEETK